MRSIIPLLLVVFSILTTSNACAREWVDATGKHRVEAVLVAIRGDKVELKKTDGTTVTLSISLLSAADRQFLQSQSKPKATPQSKLPADETETLEPVPIAGQAQTVLKRHCFRCHGENESEEGGFNFALDREKLVASGYVVPNNLAHSPLLERMTSPASPMPPEGESPRPSPEEIAAIQAWITAGAPSFIQTKSREFVSTEAMFQRVLGDLKSLNERDRPFARYFSVTHLGNAGYSREELGTHQFALAKLINSLSWNRKLASLESIDPLGYLFRVDLRALKWSAQSWEDILSHYPYGLVIDSRDASNARNLTGTEIPLVRADWFVAAASRPPLYHQLAQIPETDKKLEALLQVHVERNIEQGKTLRVGFARSGVSQNNRLIERHQSIFGAYWKSYDFAENTGRKNLFENPLGPGPAAGSFAHDGGEIIFRLPNGLLGYMLTDASGNRIERGPIEIVSDPRQPDRTVVNGVSCMSCHYGGFIQKSDEIRKHVLANATAYSGVDKVLMLYPESESVDKWLVADTKDHLSTLAAKEIGLTSPTRMGEPIVLVANRFSNEIDLPLAAAELGLPPQTFANAFEKVTDLDLRRKVGVLKTRGGVVKREAFDEVFIGLASSLGLGERFSGKRAQVTSPALATAGPTQGELATKAAATAGLIKNPEEALKAGIQALSRNELQLAESHFDNAIRLSKDKTLTARIFEQAIRLYERGESATPLIEAHKFLLDSCTNSAQIEQACANFFNSLMEFVEKPPGWFSRPRGSKEIRWGASLPTSVSNAVEAVFEAQLARTPDHEPSLRVMQLYWQRVHDNPEKRLHVLSTLDAVVKSRRQHLDIVSGIDLATLLIGNGQADAGAKVFAEIANQVEGSRSAYFKVREAEAWIKAQEQSKAIAALKTAMKELARSPDKHVGIQLVSIGDLFVSISEPFLAKESYGLALKREKNAYEIRKLQGKISDVVASSGGPADGEPSVPGKMDDLLDPALSFRVEAQRLEKEAANTPALKFHYLVQAAENWTQANDSGRAATMLRQAASTLRLRLDNSLEPDHVKLAKMFQQLELNQDALNHYAEALKLTSSEYTITEYQKNIKALMQRDSAIKVSAEFEKLVDPAYKYRVMAQTAEEQRTFDANGQASALVKATQLWGQAGDVEDVIRTGQKAESAIKKIASTQSIRPEERFLVDLAKAYEQVELHEPAVRSYVSAIGYAYQDDDAVKYFKQITTICQDNGLAVPTIDADLARKLDPLNRYRVQAADEEKKAETQTNASSALLYWMRAADNWLKANEKEKAVSAADRYVDLLEKQANTREYEFIKAAELYLRVERKDLAINAFEQAIAVARSDNQKQRLQERINTLK